MFCIIVGVNKEQFLFPCAKEDLKTLEDLGIGVPSRICTLSDYSLRSGPLQS